MPLNQTQKVEINELRDQTTPTRRATVEALEEILYEAIPVLDHGFVRAIDYMGDDSAIVQAARVSYGKGTRKINQDKGLINYLMRHRHTTPFEMCEIKFHIKLPIFIARQWVRHRTANINEYSARYSILDNEFYLPEPQHLAAQATSNRQGRDEVLSPEENKRVLEILKTDAMRVYDNYADMLNQTEEGEIIDPTKSCVARELARMNLTLNFYTQWYWKIDLHNLLHFLSLRADPHAQYEIRAYADVMLDMVKKWCPFAYEAFVEYKMEGGYFSRSGLAVLKRMLKGEKVEQATSGMSPREWREMMALLER